MTTSKPKLRLMQVGINEVALYDKSGAVIYGCDDVPVAVPSLTGSTWSTEITVSDPSGISLKSSCPVGQQVNSAVGTQQVWQLGM